MDYFIRTDSDEIYDQIHEYFIEYKIEYKNSFTKLFIIAIDLSNLDDLMLYMRYGVESIELDVSQTVLFKTKSEN